MQRHSVQRQTLVSAHRGWWGGGGGSGVLSQRQDENNVGRRIVLIKTLWLLIKYCAV